MAPTILLTGGMGYVGSHTCVELLDAGYQVIVVDNLSNSSRSVLTRIWEITARRPEFHEVDLRDKSALDQLLRTTPVDAVIHFAGLKSVAESVAQPLLYYEDNLLGTANLVRSMESHGIRRLVFSSSATVYGVPDRLPILESAPLRPINPYGRTKLFIEEMLRDIAAASSGWHILLLRYFNPVGAHSTGLLGEDPVGVPNNLMPYVMQTAIGQRQGIRVFGGDYPTPDGTAVRDYIHVVDLAAGHMAALAKLDEVEGCTALNLGTGRGYSVLEVISAASTAVGRSLPFKIVERRPGDAPCMYADTSSAASFLGWRAVNGLDDICRDHWLWQRKNPKGYETRRA